MIPLLWKELYQNWAIEQGNKFSLNLTDPQAWPGCRAEAWIYNYLQTASDRE